MDSHTEQPNILHQQLMIIELKKNISTLILISNKKDTEIFKLTSKINILISENKKLCLENEQLVQDTYLLADQINSLTEQLNTI